MHLVDEENRPPAAARTADFGPGDRLAYVPDSGKNGREGDELGSEGIRHQASQGRLADPGRPPEDHAVRLAGLKGDGEWLALPEQVGLADHFGQRPRPQPLSKRHVRVLFGGQAGHFSFPSGSKRHDRHRPATEVRPDGPRSTHVKRFLPPADDDGRRRAPYHAPQARRPLVTRRGPGRRWRHDRDREIPHGRFRRASVSSRHRFEQ